MTQFDHVRMETIHPGQEFERTDYDAADAVFSGQGQTSLPVRSLTLVSGEKGEGPFIWTDQDPFFICPKCNSRYPVSENTEMKEGEQCKRRYDWKPPRPKNGKYENNAPIRLTCSGSLGRPGRIVERLDPLGHEFRLALAWRSRRVDSLSQRDRTKAEAYHNKWFTKEGAERRRASLVNG
jgi:hypothetical protein